MAEADLGKLKELYEGKSMSECFALLHQKNESCITELKTHIHEIRADVDNLKEYTQHIDEAVREINERTIENLRVELNEERKKRLELEQWSRKWNVVIRGVGGDLKETPAETEGKVRDFFVKVLNFPRGRDVLFQAVHRLPSGQEGKRNIIARFLNLSDRDDVVRAAYKLQRGSGFGVSPDLNPEASKLRSELLNERRELPLSERRRAKIVYMKTYPFVALRRS